MGQVVNVAVLRMPDPTILADLRVEISIRDRTGRIGLPEEDVGAADLFDELGLRLHESLPTSETQTYLMLDFKSLFCQCDEKLEVSAEGPILWLIEGLGRNKKPIFPRAVLKYNNLLVGGQNVG